MLQYPLLALVVMDGVVEASGDDEHVGEGNVVAVTAGTSEA